MSVKEHDFDVIKLFWFELAVINVDQFCGFQGIPVAEREINDFGQRESSARVPENGKPDIGEPLDHTVIALSRWRESAARENSHFYSAIGSFLDFFAPFYGKDSVLVRGGKEVGVGKFDGFCLPENRRSGKHEAYQHGTEDANRPL
jgi:hypothetical protein